MWVRLLGAVLVFAGVTGLWWVADQADRLLGRSWVPPFDFWVLGRPFTVVTMGVGAVAGVAWSRRQGTTTRRVKGGKLTTLGVTTGFTNAGVTPGFTVGKPRQGDGTQSCVVTLPSGVVASKVKGLREHVAAAHRVPVDRVTVAPDGGRADRVKVTLTDELPTLKPRSPGLPTVHGWHHPVCLGRDTRGRDYHVPVYDIGQWLIGGETGSGKTTALRLLAAHYAADPGTVIWGCDGKGSWDDWGPFVPRCERWVMVTDPDPEQEYLRMLRDLVTLVNGRNRAGGRDHPGMLVILEEATAFRAALSKTDQVEHDRLLTRVVQTCRSANVLVVVAAQRPSASLMSTNVRAQAGVNLCMRVRSLVDAEMVLGYRPGDDVLTYPAGHGLVDAGGAPVRVLVDHLREAEWRGLCAQWVTGPGPQDTAPQDDTDPLLAAVELVLTDRGTCTPTQLWEALPGELRTVSPSSLGRALTDRGVTPVRQRVNGAVSRVYTRVTCDA